MKVLLIGPRPPPHGGISVHVSGIHAQLLAAGMTCHVLDMSIGRPGFGFGLAILSHALRGWTLHFHTNGHNGKSWLLALGCGLAGHVRGGSVLTLHSGMTPAYLEAAPPWRRKLAALACSLYSQTICVNPEIKRALLALGLEPQRTKVLPAFLNATLRDVSPALELRSWLGRHQPLLSTVLFFRPEYGFDALVACLSRLKGLHPAFGCLVMGSGEQRDEAEKRTREAGLEDSILLLGDVDHDSCLKLISLSDVFLRPTLEDGDSISVREALTLGVPVVASRAGARPAGAILFDPGDVDGMLAKIQQAVAQNRANPRQQEGFMDSLMDIYRQVDASEGSKCLN